MSIQIDGKTSVRELVGRYPQTRKIFEDHGIDYCCGGGQSLADAAGQRALLSPALPMFTLSGQKADESGSLAAPASISLPLLLAALEEAIRTAPGQAEVRDRDWYAAPLAELVSHIVEVHHGYLRQALPRLRLLTQKVLSAHGAQHGEMLRQVQDLFRALDAELTPHLMKEEEVLFPFIVALEVHVRDGAAEPSACFGSVRNPIRQMEHEHESAGATLAKLRTVTADYALPPDACPTFAAMYEEFQQMEADLHQHIHLENNILFPRAGELENSAGEGGDSA